MKKICGMVAGKEVRYQLRFEKLAQTGRVREDRLFNQQQASVWIMYMRMFVCVRAQSLMCIFEFVYMYVCVCARARVYYVLHVHGSCIMHIRMGINMCMAIAAMH